MVYVLFGNFIFAFIAQMFSGYLLNLPPEHPIMSFKTIENKMAAVSLKRCIVLVFGFASRTVDFVIG